jgi:hypothetical protein
MNLKCFSDIYMNPLTLPLFPGDCVVIAEMVKNVMLNLFQHLMESITYETLKRVQGDKKGITTQSPVGRGRGDTTFA